MKARLWLGSDNTYFIDSGRHGLSEARLRSHIKRQGLNATFCAVETSNKPNGMAITSETRVARLEIYPYSHMYHVHRGNCR